MGPVSGLTLAHGGLIGAVVEGAIVVAVTGVFVAVWLRERSARRQSASEKLKDRDG